MISLQNSWHFISPFYGRVVCSMHQSLPSVDSPVCVLDAHLYFYYFLPQATLLDKKASIYKGKLIKAVI